jgi:transcriptional regulator with XRE-family HTH domain
MTNSTLGGLIKDYRLQKGISQLDIAFSLGWKEPSRLSRIEQGRTERPPRELIDKIINAIGLEEQEKNTLLLTGGYLPTEEEIESIRKETKPLIERHPYPASVMDYSWRVISQNKHNIQLFKFGAEEEKRILEHKPRILDILFNLPLQKPVVTNTYDNRYDFLKSVLVNFKYEQRHRTKEKWFIEHIKKLMDNDTFRELWVVTDAKYKLDGIVGKYVIKCLPAANNSQLLKFFLFVVPVLKDPRFEVELLVPADLDTFNYYQNI